MCARARARVCVCVWGQQRERERERENSHQHTTEISHCLYTNQLRSMDTNVKKRRVHVCMRARTHAHTHTHTNCQVMTFTHSFELLYSIIKFNYNKWSLSANCDILLHSFCHTSNSVCPSTSDSCTKAKAVAYEWLNLFLPSSPGTTCTIQV